MTHSHEQFAPSTVADALDTALERMRAGIRPDPKDTQAAELEPLLQLGVQLHHEAQQPLPAELERWLPHGAREYARIVNQAHPPRISRFRIWWQRALQPTLTALVVAGLLIAAVDTVSATSLPGDALYTWKIAREDLYLSITPSAADRRALHVDFARRRLAEVDRLVAQGMPASSPLIAAAFSSFLAHVQHAVDETAPVSISSDSDSITSLLSEAQQRLLQVSSTTDMALSPNLDEVQNRLEDLTTRGAPVSVPAAPAPSRSPTPTPSPSPVLASESVGTDTLPLPPTATPSATAVAPTRAPARQPNPTDTLVPTSTVVPTLAAATPTRETPSATSTPSQAAPAARTPLPTRRATDVPTAPPTPPPTATPVPTMTQTALPPPPTAPP
nr:DUF5667 domain-containing protein [Roseiflexaceae bacterium]